MSIERASLATLAHALIGNRIGAGARPSSHARWTFASTCTRELTAMFEEGDVSTMLRGSQSVTVRLESGGRTRILRVPGSAAREMYGAGLPVVVDEHPALERVAAAIARELDVPAHTVTSNLFASKSGGVAPLHFDRAFSVAFQLVGRKKWSVRRNDLVDAPMTGWVLGDPVGAELRAHTSEPFPTVPYDCKEELVGPGDALSIPRGYWHATEALDDSLSINVYVALPTWTDLVLPALRRMLEQDAAWRAEVPAHVSPGEIEGQLARLRDILPHVSSSLCAHSSQAPADKSAASFRRIPTSTFGIDDAVAGKCTVHSLAKSGIRSVVLEVPPATLAACVRISHGKPTTAVSFAREAGINVTDALELLGALVDAGYLSANEQGVSAPSYSLTSSRSVDSALA